MKPEEYPPTSGAISQALAEFKRCGCTLLLIGVPYEAHTELCGRLLGDVAGRVLVRTDGTASTTDRGISGGVRIVDRSASIRSASAAGTSSEESLPQLSRTISDAIAAANSNVPDEPGVVRICLDSIRPYVDGAPPTALRTFLSELRETAREHGAIVHVHLPAAPDTNPESLCETVDAIVEVSLREEEYYQRWRLPSASATTDWIEV